LTVELVGTREPLLVTAAVAICHQRVVRTLALFVSEVD